LNVSLVEEALNQVIRQQSALRTVFRIVAGEPMQVVLPTIATPFVVVDLTNLTPNEQQRRLRDHFDAEAQQPRDLSTGPLFRVTLFRLAPERHHAVLALHHAVFDGWSLGVMIDQWWSAYAALLAGRSPQLRNSAMEYTTFAERQRDSLFGDRLNQLTRFWQKQLATPPPRIRWPGSGVASAPAARREFVTQHWSSPNYAAWKELCRREGATPFMGLVAALTKVLKEVTGHEDFVFGSPIANRARPETRDLIGSFSHLLLLRMDAGGNPASFELLRRAKRVVADALDHQDLPYASLVERLLSPAAAERQEPFQVRLAFQNYPLPVPKLPGLSIELLDEDSGTSRFDLALEAFEKPDGLRLLFKFRPQAVLSSLVHEISNRLRNAL
jgi:hypothetical protein